MNTRVSKLLGLLGLLAGISWAILASAQGVDRRILLNEAKRIAVIEKVRPTVVAVFMAGGQGGGSGVLISEDGYALTNFHVVAGMMRQAAPVMQCGLPDGGYYHAVVVGLDKVGDVALIKLLPNKQGQKFPFAPLGDSDKIKEGDWSLAMGNPFLLATDFTPTVTFGLVSGVHRYQYPEGTLLEYTDCIQIDTSINPGNSGGPLFNMNGELIGINGRGSFDKRSRINSGVGYAISINQIKNFLGHLKAGIDTDHATLGATVQSEKEEGDLGRLLVTDMVENSDVARRGLKADDQLWKFGFDNRLLLSVNQFKNVLGIFPKAWRVPLVYKRNNQETEVLVRLMAHERQQQAQPAQPPPNARVRPAAPAGPPSPAAKLFEAKKGFANYYFNKLERDRVLAGFKKHGDFSATAGAWTLTAQGRLHDQKDTETATFGVALVQGKEDKSATPQIKMKMGNVDYTVYPLKGEQSPTDLKEPNDSGGLLLGLYLYKRLLTLGVKGFEVCDHGGREPLYPYPTDGSKPRRLGGLRVDTEVLRTQHGPYRAKWFFSLKDKTLLGAEIRMDEDEDPCEIYFSNYKQVDGRMLPGTMDVRFGNDRYGTFTLQTFKMEK